MKKEFDVSRYFGTVCPLCCCSDGWIDLIDGCWLKCKCDGELQVYG
jgi:hypothetical protein